MNQGKEVLLPIHIPEGNRTNGAHVMMDKAAAFVKLVPVRALQLAHPFYLLTKSEGMQHGQAGDYLVMFPQSKERWICPRALFEQVYVPQRALEGFAEKIKLD